MLYSNQPRFLRKHATMIVRRIQLAAAGMSFFFALFALLDVVFETMPRDSSEVFPFPMMSLLSWHWAVGSAIILTLVAGLTLLTISLSKRAECCHDFTRLDHIRRLTWGLSIFETTGCVMLALRGIPYYLPSALALLIVGVAELMTILSDIRYRIHSSDRKNTFHHI